MVLVALLLLPALFATWSFASVLNGQVDFAASERRGVSVVRPALLALADTTTGRTTDLAPLRAVVQQHPELGAEQALDAVSAAAQAGDGPVHRAVTAQALAALITTVGDSSKLILDPDLDSFYVMDALVVQLPRALTATAHTATAEAAAGTLEPDGQAELVASRAVLAGALTGSAAAVRSDLATAGRNTSAPTLRDRTATARPSSDALEALAERISASLDEPTSQEAAGRTAVGDAAAAAVGPLTSLLDELLQARGDALTARRTWTLGLTVTGLAMALWLALAVIWRTRSDVGLAVSAAGAIRDGDLHAQLLPGGRDEFGDIGRALDGARARLQSTV